MNLHPVISATTTRIRERSAAGRAQYLRRVEAARKAGTSRAHVSCTNLAHAVAAFSPHDKLVLRSQQRPNLAIVSSYNDMLSAHQPLGRFPEIIKQAARDAGAVAQFAGGVPAMCDGVTQGQPGMELSLFSRDVIAMATAIALSHNVFDGVLCLGVCDKIVPGLQSYHGPGTCTFYGTANSNQMLMEVMGLHLPGAAFVHPNTALRDALTGAAAQRAVAIAQAGTEYTPIADVVDERAIVNAIVGLLATGGSTNHTIHLVAIARAAGITIDWDDFDRLSRAVPLLARIYPNGSADVNQFHAAGGMGLLIRQLLSAGLLHADVKTVVGSGLSSYTQEPYLDDEGALKWRPAPERSLDAEILAEAGRPFSAEGGLKLLTGNLGRAVIKVSAVKAQHRVVEAPALVFDGQDALLDAFKQGRLQRDFVAVVRYQGPRANGMPELHKLTPTLGVLQDQGFKVALVTDGRMSGASGKVPAAIHVTPECLDGGPLARVRDGDPIRLDAEGGVLEVRVDAGEWARRTVSPPDLEHNHHGLGRELFAGARVLAAGAEQGAVIFAASERSAPVAATMSMT